MSKKELSQNDELKAQALLEDTENKAEKESKKKKKRKKLVITIIIFFIVAIIYYAWSTKTVVQPRDDSSSPSVPSESSSLQTEEELKATEKKMNNKYSDYMSRINPFTFENHKVSANLISKQNNLGFTADQWTDGAYIEIHDVSGSFEFYIQDTSVLLHTTKSDNTENWYNCVVSPSDRIDFYNSIVTLIVSNAHLDKAIATMEKNPSILYQNTVEEEGKKFAVFALDLNETPAGDPGENEYAEQQANQGSNVGGELIDVDPADFESPEELDKYLVDSYTDTDTVSQILYYIDITNDDDVKMDQVEAIYADNQTAVINYTDGEAVEMPQDTSSESIDKDTMIEKISTVLGKMSF